MTALMRSRRKIQLKVRETDVVPAPDDPVTAMTGCFADMMASRAARLEVLGFRDAFGVLLSILPRLL
jgi:hypothetical protein